MNTPGFLFDLQQSRKTQRDLKKNSGIPETCATLPYWNCGNTRAVRRRPRHLCQDCVVIAPALAAVSSPFCAAGEDGSVHRPPIHHPCLVFTTPPFIYPSVHLSIHQSISPFVAHVDPSVTPPAPPAVHIQTSRPSVSAGFQNWLKYAIPSGWRGDGDISRCTEDFFFYFNFVH